MKIVRFLAPNVTGYQMRYWDEYLPMRLVPQSNALFVGMDYYAPAVAILRDYYPGGTEVVHSTPQGRMMFVSYQLDAESILATKGLSAHYSSTEGEQRVLDRRDDSIDFDWGQDAPLGQAAFAANVGWQPARPGVRAVCPSRLRAAATRRSGSTAARYCARRPTSPALRRVSHFTRAGM